jgi:hypothetical protein
VSGNQLEQRNADERKVDAEQDNGAVISTCAHRGSAGHERGERPGAWLFIADGAARVIEEGQDREDAVDALRAKYPQYGEQVPTGPVVEVTVDRWVGWAFRDR